MADERTFEVVTAMAGPHRQHGTPAVGASARLAANMTMAPIVSTLPQAASMFRLEPTRLAQAVAEAGLEPWPWRHADGSQVWRYAELAELAAGLGAKVRIPPSRKGWQERRRSKRRTARQEP
jgi:hypothetical protein